MKKFLSILLSAAVVVAGAFLIFSIDQIKDDFVNSKRPIITMLTNSEGSSGGTGFYVRAPSGKVYVLTNGHVCGLGKDGKIFSRNEDVTILNILEVYPAHDLCLIEAPAGAHGLKVAKRTRVGENIYVLGHPLLEPKTLTKGQMSGDVNIEIMQGFDVPCEGKGFRKISVADTLYGALYRATYACVRDLESQVVTANILPGNSGSPVLNAYGHVVGVAFAGREGSGRGYIVPLSEVKEFLGGK